MDSPELLAAVEAMRQSYRDRYPLHDGPITIYFPDWVWEKAGEEELHAAMKRVYGNRAVAARYGGTFGGTD